MIRTHASWRIMWRINQLSELGIALECVGVESMVGPGQGSDICARRHKVKLAYVWLRRRVCSALIGRNWPFQASIPLAHLCNRDSCFRLALVHLCNSDLCLVSAGIKVSRCIVTFALHADHSQLDSFLVAALRCEERAIRDRSLSEHATHDGTCSVRASGRK